MAQIRKAITTKSLTYAYDCLKATVSFFADIEVLDYDIRSDEYFQDLRKFGLRLGTQDLRIAAITLAYIGSLLTRNLRDFEKVPDLIIQDWSI